MKKFLFSLVILFSAILTSRKTEPQKPLPAPKADISDFLGQWTIDIGKGGVGNVGWLEVRQEDKYLDGDLLWGGGSVLPVSNMFLTNEKLIVTMTENVVRKRDENNN